MKDFTHKEKIDWIKESYKNDDQVDENVGDWDVEEAILALQQLGKALDSPFWVHQE